MQIGLFGVMESKQEIRERARGIRSLLDGLSAAKIDAEAYDGQAGRLEAILAKSDQRALDENDWDAIMREVQEFGEAETAEQQAAEDAFNSNPKNFRPYMIGWGGAVEGDVFPVSLSPVEDSQLREMAATLRSEAREMIDAGDAGRAELQRLQSVGPLPEEIARQHGLTPEGDDQARGSS